MTLFILCICALGFTHWLSPDGQNQDMSVEELLQNLKTKHYTGKPIDLDLEEVSIETLFSNLEKFSGISFELSPDVLLLSKEKRTFKFNRVPWDKIMSFALKEFSLESVLKDGAVYVQPRKDTTMQVIREDQLRMHEPFRLHPLFIVLIVLMLAGGATGILLYKRKDRTKQKALRKFVIDPEKADEVMKKVRYLFEVEKIFKQEDISLQSLSEELSIPSYQLSWIINKRMNTAFSRLINSYRVEEVKKRLASPQDVDKNILDIAFEAGFNTKTSFNRVFKKLTRMTPSQYRQRYRPKKTA